jgi:hypothetical protein
MEAIALRTNILLRILLLSCIVTSCSGTTGTPPVQPNTATPLVQTTATPLIYTLPASSKSAAEQLIRVPISVPYFMWAVDPDPGSTVRSADRVIVAVAPAALWEPGVGSSADFGDDIGAGYILILDAETVPRVYTEVYGDGALLIFHDPVTREQRSYAGGSWLKGK